MKTKKLDKKIRFSNLYYKINKEFNVLNKQRIKALKLYNTIISEIDFQKYWKEFNSKYEISNYDTLIEHKGYDLPIENLNLKIEKNVR